MRPSLSSSAANGICGSSPSVGSSHKRRDQAHQVAVAGLVLRQEHDRGPRVVPLDGAQEGGGGVAEIDRRLRADDRLHARLGELLREFERAEQVVGVGDRHRRHRVGLGELGQRLDRQRPLAQRIGAVHVQMHEPDRFEDRRFHARHCRKPAHARRAGPVDSARLPSPIARRQTGVLPNAHAGEGPGMRGLPGSRFPALMRSLAPRSSPRTSSAVSAAHDSLEVDDDVEAVAPVLRRDGRLANGHRSNFGGFRHRPRPTFRIRFADERAEMASLATVSQGGGTADSKADEQRRRGDDDAQQSGPWQR